MVALLSIGVYNVSDELKKGRVTIPTDEGIVNETLNVLDYWGADAIRDCDGTEFPVELKDSGAKVYSTYYTTRKDNAWAKANPDEVQQMYIMTKFSSTSEGPLSIHLMDNLYPDMPTEPQEKSSLHAAGHTVRRPEMSQSPRQSRSMNIR